MTTNTNLQPDQYGERGERCEICDVAFTAEEWEDRHWYHPPNCDQRYGEDDCRCATLEVHATCCPDCTPPERQSLGEAKLPGGWS